MIKVLIILGAVALALWLISCIRLGVLAEYSASGALVRLKVGAFKLTVYPPKPKKAKRKKEKKPKKAKQKKEAAPAAKKGGSFALLKKFLPIITEAAGRMRKKIRIDTLYLDFTAAASDPAAAAMAFGGANAAIGMIWPLIEQNFTVKDRRIRTAVDFDAKAPVIFLSAAATMTIGQAFSLGARLLFKFLRLFAEYRAGTKATNTNEQKQKEAV